MPAQFGDEGLHLGRSQAPGRLAVNDLFAAGSHCLCFHGRRVGKAYSLVPDFVLCFYMRLLLCMISLSDADAWSKAVAGDRPCAALAGLSQTSFPHAAFRQRER